jgi:predicted MFS family arabinose efflux permease
VLRRALDVSYHEHVRSDITTLTIGRLAANSAYRFAAPFLATIARGLDVSIADLGVALAVTELAGLASPMVGRLVDRLPRRRSMSLGLVGVAAGAVVAGIAGDRVMFAAGIVLLAISKTFYDVGLGAWVADHVPYERRGRVVGLTETSWALGLLVGVSILGLVVLVAGWRRAYVVAAVAALAMSSLVAARLRADTTVSEQPPHRAQPGRITDIDGAGWASVAGALGLMGGAQCLFLTFGPWLEDRHGFGAAGLSTVVFGLGAGELVASSLSAARTDRWGKERSVAAGAMVMVPAGIVMALGSDQPAVGLAALVVFVVGFEFAIVSMISLGSALIPSAPAKGIGTMIAAGTFGRALLSIPATWSYERHGVAPPAVMGAVLATFTIASIRTRHHLLGRSGLSSSTASTTTPGRMP